MAGILIENPVKSGWLSMQLPETNCDLHHRSDFVPFSPQPKVFKNYYVILRSSTMDFYSGLKEAERYPSVTQRQILLKNCLIIQAVKKGTVKHGFTLLLVPEGLYVICASSESEKNVWLRIIRQTISDQAKSLSQAEKQKKNGNDAQTRNKVDLLKSSKVSGRFQINRGKSRIEKEVTESLAKGTLKKGEIEGFPYEGREGVRVMPEVKNGMHRKGSPRDLINTDAKNTSRPNGESHKSGVSDSKLLEQENLDTLSTAETLSISSVRAPVVRQRSTDSETRLSQQSNLKSIRDEQKSLDVLSTKTKSVTSKTPSVIYPSTPTIVDVVDQRKQETVPNMKPQRRQPETERLERKAYHFDLISLEPKRNSHATRQDSRGIELTSPKAQFKRNESPDSSRETLSNFNRDNIRIDRVFQDDNLYKERQKQSQSMKWDKTDGVKKTGSITILREEEPSKEVKRIEREFVIEVRSPISRRPVSPSSSAVAQGKDSSLSKQDSSSKLTKEDSSVVQWKHTGVAPVQSSILNFRKSVSRWKPDANGGRKIDLAKDNTASMNETEKWLILENQVLRERLKTLDAQKCTSNVYEQTVSGVDYVFCFSHAYCTTYFHKVRFIKHFSPGL
ncbi:uncharacterized protein DEA37_0009246 [Paragonimus westermani]|uniref:PH domain-containing protein n=1 Tax=Paragonimus westermani TaxID=34504 RepID=A0A5J4NZ94_9TREM|nr:uncharacterized protein DEA37_0009246 [Paragonimus westermani]